MADTTRSAVPTRPIHWQEVIELDTRMTLGDYETLLGALDEIESTTIGQQKFAETLTIKQTYEEGERAAGLQADDTGARYKISIAALSVQEKDHSLYQEVVHGGGGGYFPYENVILFHIETARNARIPNMTAAGEVFVVAPLAEIVLHELQHALDHRHLNASTTSYTKACLEERAIATENAYIQESFPGKTLRSSYIAAEAQFMQGLADNKRIYPSMFSATLKANPTNPEMEQGLHIPTATAWENTLIENLTLDAGCQNPSPQSMREKARAILLNSGIRADLLDSVQHEPSDVTIPAALAPDKTSAQPASATRER